MNTTLYVRPDEMWSAGATVTVSAGAVDADYRAAWAVDGTTRPVRATTGTLTLALAKAAATVDLVAIGHHHIDAGGAIVFGGDLSATLVPDPYGPNGIATNPWTQVEPSVVDAVTVAVSGNSTDVLIGDIIIGAARELTPLNLQGHQFGVDDYAKPPAGEFLSVLPYDRGAYARSLKGSQVYTATELNDILEWFQSQRSGSRPSLYIPNPDLNDAWFGFLQRPTYVALVPESPMGSPVTTEGLYLVTLEFTELPRLRW